MSRSMIKPLTHLAHLALTGAALLMCSLSAQAQQVNTDVCQQLAARNADQRTLAARPSPLDNRLVVFPWAATGLYTLHTHHNLHTHIELDPSEKIIASYLNDETLYQQTVVESTLRDLFIRPLVKGAVGGLTVITDKRRYQIELYEVSACPSLTRYQRVSWHQPTGLWNAPGATGGSSEGAPHLAPAAPGDQPGAIAGDQTDVRVAPSRVDVSQLNLEYEITGDAQIRPLRVFDDGRRTFIQFPDNMGLRPAVFVVAHDGQGEPVEYIPKGNTFELARTFDHGLLLKLGKLEARVRNLAKSRCGWFDKACKGVSITNVGGAQ
jgi:type IV secretion system protein TrbG